MPSDMPELLMGKIFDDNRGSMSIILENETFETRIVKMTRSAHGVLRGFHVQAKPNNQRKKIIVISGVIQDVLIRMDESGSPTGEVVEYVIDANKFNGHLDIPDNWAHAYLTLSEESLVMYLCDGIYGNEKVLNPIVNYRSWMIPDSKIIISEKDGI